MNKSNKTVLLTGFAGFIGSRILRDLVAKEFNVVGVDNLTTGSALSNYQDLDTHPNVRLFFECIEDPDLYHIVKNYRIDYIINCAAQSHVDRSWDDLNEFLSSNIKGPINMAQIALKLAQNHPLKSFVQVSTDEVFDGQIQPFTESSRISPSNIYSSSKASAEMFLKNYHEAYKLPLIITNGANTYGPRQFKEKIIPKAISLISLGKKVPLFKTPARRMWLHVEDHSSGIIQAMLNGKIGERYCLAPDKECELYTHKLVIALSELMGVSHTQSIEYVADRVNYDLRYYMSNKKAVDHLAWRPRKRILEELTNLIEYYRDKK